MKTFKISVPENGIGRSEEERLRKRMIEAEKVLKKGKTKYIIQTTLIFVVCYPSIQFLISKDKDLFRGIFVGAFTGLVVSLVQWRQYSKIQKKNQSKAE